MKRTCWILIVLLIVVNSVCSFAEPLKNQTNVFEEFMAMNNANLNSINFLSIKNVIDNDKQKLEKVTVAIVDTGIDTSHPDLKDCLVPGYNFVDNSNEMYDDSGHGTLLAGVIGGKKTGIANGVKIMPIKVLDNNGFGKTENFVKGIIWAVDNGANIINLSIGRRRFVELEEGVENDTFSEIEYKAIEYALLKNVTVVLPCGNFNQTELCYPAAYVYKQTQPKPIIVAGVNGDEKFLWSNTSTFIDISCPADNILSTIPKELDKNIEGYYNLENDGYSFCGGTSISCAYATALAAILKSYDYNLSNEQIRNIIISSAKDIGEKGKDKNFGYGKIDFRKSLLLQRINIECNENELYENEKCTFKITANDYKNMQVEYFEKYHDPKDDIIDVEANTIEEAKKIENEKEKDYSTLNTKINMEVYRYYDYQDIYVLKDSFLLNIGSGQVIKDLLIHTSGVYKISFSNSNGNLVGNQYYLKVKPNKPTVNLSQGIHIGKQTIKIQGKESGADIYYTLGDVPVLTNDEVNSLAKRYEEPFSIGSNKVINVVIKKNGITSEVVSFKYTIIPIFELVLGTMFLILCSYIIVKFFKKEKIK